MQTSPVTSIALFRDRKVTERQYIHSLAHRLAYPNAISDELVRQALAAWRAALSRCPAPSTRATRWPLG